MVEISRLVAFGCSNTYGHGLPDCVSKEMSFGPEPSKYAWPQVLADLLGIDVVINQANPGSSNKDIARRILNFDFKEDDLVVVGWSYVERSSIFRSNQDKDTLKLGINYKDKINKIYQRHLFNYYNNSFETGIYSSYAINRIESKVSNSFNFFCCHESPIIEFDFFKNIKDIKYSKIIGTYGTASDKFHPNIESQKVIAERLKDLICHSRCTT